MAELFGIVSGAVGVASFLAEGLSILASGSSRFAKYKELVERHRNSLFHVERQLKIWRKKWALDSVASHKLHERWGEQGSTEIFHQLGLIKEDINTIQKRLYGQDELPQSEATKWYQLVQSADRPRAARNAAKSGFLHRLAYAIYKDEDLHKRVTLLERHLEMLLRLSDDNWIRAQGLTIGKTIDADGIAQCLKLKHNARECSRALSITHQYLNSQYGSWALLLRLPDEAPVCPLFDPTLVTFELLGAETFAQDKTVKKVRVCYCYDNDRYRRDLQVSLDDPTTVGIGVLKHNMKSFFDMVRRQSEREQKKLRRGYLVERAHTALSVTSWVIAAWSSDWMTGFCNCVVRPAKLQNQKLSTLSHRCGGQSTLCLLLQDGHRVPCFPPQVSNRRHLQLAVVLAELALGALISVIVVNREVKFGLNPTMSAAVDMIVDEAGLLSTILNKSHSRPFKAAIYSCLKYDKMEQDASNPAYLPGQMLQGEAVKRYEQEVIQKLQEHYTRVLRVCEDHQPASSHFQGHQLLRDY